MADSNRPTGAIAIGLQLVALYSVLFQHGFALIDS